MEQELSPYHLRLGEVANAAEIEAVHWASAEAAYGGHVPEWPETPRDIEARVKRWSTWLTSPEIDVILAVCDGEVVGFCTLRPATDADLDPTTDCEMPTLYVHPRHWRRGCGTALCREVMRRAGERGFSHLTLWVLDINGRAQDFYRGLGFTPDGQTKLDDYSAEPLIGRRFGIQLRHAF